jgi:hypothetical protein
MAVSSMVVLLVIQTHQPEPFELMGLLEAAGD